MRARPLPDAAARRGATRHPGGRALRASLLATALLLAAPAGAEVGVTGLETDAAATPLGIEATQPRLSWRLEADTRGAAQTRCRVVVASTAARAAAGTGDVWDSGALATPAPFVDYAGAPLAPHTRYHWSVRVWDEAGVPTPWATPTWFETAFLDPAAWTAAWIAGPPRPATDGLAGLATPAETAATGDACRPAGRPGVLSLAAFPARLAYEAAWPTACRRVRPAPLLRRAFHVGETPTAARLYVAGLAYAESTLNGTRIGGPTVLDPGYTDWARTVLYTTHDVTDLVVPGENVLGVELGSGFYDYDVISEWAWTAADWRGEPRLRLELHLRFADGRAAVVRSDDTWQTAPGPTRWDNVNVGETFDARFAPAGWAAPGFDARGWQAARVVPGPAGRLTAQAHEPIAIVASRAPTTVSHPRPGVTVYDVGEQTSGWLELALTAPAGAAAVIVYGESLLDDGSVDTRWNLHIAEQIQTDVVVSAGTPLRWHPRFSYKGFRYVQVSGPRGTAYAGTIDDAVVHVVRSAVPAIGGFASSHPLLDAIFANLRRAIANNLHGIVTDTPTYEKNGWLGDAQLTAPTTTLLFDMQRFYRKWLGDMRDAQRPSGEIPDIVPSGEQYGYTGVGWAPIWGPTPVGDAALFLVPWEVHARYGDDRLLRESRDAMRRYLDDWVPQWANGRLLDAGLGDHVTPAASPVTAVVSTAYYAEFAGRLAALAALVGDDTDRTRYAALHAEIRDAFNTAFYDPAAGIYRDRPADGFLQTANVLPLALGLVPPARRAGVVAALVADVAAQGGNLATGVAGTRWLLPALTAAGALDVAFGIATQTDYPSWGEWIARGDTALNENWGPALRSRDHHFLGSIGQWLIEELAGLAPAAPGFAEIAFRPGVPARGLDHARAWHDSVRGPIATCWERPPGGFLLDVTVPPNAQGLAAVPADDPSEVRETGLGTEFPAHAAPGVTLAGTEPGRVLYRFGSGTYRFRAGNASAADACDGDRTPPERCDNCLDDDGDGRIDLDDADCCVPASAVVRGLRLRPRAGGRTDLQLHADLPGDALPLDGAAPDVQLQLRDDDGPVLCTRLDHTAFRRVRGGFAYRDRGDGTPARATVRPRPDGRITLRARDRRGMLSRVPAETALALLVGRASVGPGACARATAVLARGPRGALRLPRHETRSDPGRPPESPP